jgi:hypothetical protein
MFRPVITVSINCSPIENAQIAAVNAVDNAQAVAVNAVTGTVEVANSAVTNAQDAVVNAGIAAQDAVDHVQNTVSDVVVATSASLEATGQALIYALMSAKEQLHHLANDFDSQVLIYIIYNSPNATLRSAFSWKKLVKLVKKITQKNCNKKILRKKKNLKFSVNFFFKFFLPNGVLRLIWSMPAKIWGV